MSNDGMNEGVKEKNTLTAYLLWLPPLGLLGAHRFYLGQRWAGVRMGVIFSVASIWLVLGILAWQTSLVHGFFGGSLLYIPVCAVTIVWWISDGVLIHSRVPTSQTSGTVNIGRKKNMNTAQRLWLIFGLFGAHRMYAGRYDSGQTMLVFFSVALGWIFWFFVIDSRPNGEPYGSRIYIFFILLYSGPFLTVVLPWWLLDGLAVGDMVAGRNAKPLTASRDESLNP